MTDSSSNQNLNHQFFSSFNQNTQPNPNQNQPIAPSQPTFTQTVTVQPVAPAATPTYSQSPLPPQNFESTNTPTKSMKNNTTLFLFLTVIAILLGIGTGWGVHAYTAGNQKNTTTLSTGQTAVGNNVQNGQMFGDTKGTYADSAEGYLEKGGNSAEGSHRLLRDNNPARTVYLTSADVDLSKLEGMKVKVWGKTQQAEKVGWLMDVAKAQVVEANATRPDQKENAGDEETAPVVDEEASE